MIKEKIQNGQTFLGIEFGSTRIKACLIDDSFTPIAGGSFDWENKFENGFWTYDINLIHKGLTESFCALKKDVFEKYGVNLTKVEAMGISGMMHGYLPFDKNGNLLTPFRTWRNTTNEKAASELSKLFGFNVPQRWSIAHLYQAILNGEEHVRDIAYITTLAGYIHYLLTGRLEVGIGEASGISPVSGNDYDKEMLRKFDNLISGKYTWSICDILPKVRSAGESCGFLTEEGALLLDPSGEFKAGVKLCPPEGDAGTGMVATNAVTPRTGNVSAGTSIFAMIVLENKLRSYYSEVDVVTTPDGSPVAMIHCNNCAAEIDSWVNIFGEFSVIAGLELTKSDLYSMLYNHSLKADADCGSVVAYNYLSGEHVTGIENGKPMYFRSHSSNMNLANFMRAQLYSTMATLKTGMDILTCNECININNIQAHGGLFKVEGIAQQILANALNTPVTVMQTAGEGGAWGMALLAAFSAIGSSSLPDWLESKVFSAMKTSTLSPDAEGVEGFRKYTELYKQALCAQKALERL